MDQLIHRLEPASLRKRGNNGQAPLSEHKDHHLMHGALQPFEDVTHRTERLRIGGGIPHRQEEQAPEPEDIPDSRARDKRKKR